MHVCLFALVYRFRSQWNSHGFWTDRPISSIVGILQKWNPKQCRYFCRKCNKENTKRFRSAIDCKIRHKLRQIDDGPATESDFGFNFERTTAIARKYQNRSLDLHFFTFGWNISSVKYRAAITTDSLCHAPFKFTSVNWIWICSFSTSGSFIAQRDEMHSVQFQWSMPLCTTINLVLCEAMRQQSKTYHCRWAYKRRQMFRLWWKSEWIWGKSESQHIKSKLTKIIHLIAASTFYVQQSIDSSFWSKKFWYTSFVWSYMSRYTSKTLRWIVWRWFGVGWSVLANRYIRHTSADIHRLEFLQISRITNHQIWSCLKKCLYIYNKSGKLINGISIVFRFVWIVSKIFLFCYALMNILVQATSLQTTLNITM